jgi:hypothetical protein
MNSIRDVPIIYPPVKQGMLYGGKGAVEIIADNVDALFNHTNSQRNDIENLRGAIANKFDELERRIQDAVALMHYTMKFYPHVVDEFRTAQKTKERIGVEAPLL